MKRAVVLAGGGARGAYQVGMLQELVLNKGLDFEVLRGVSVGALNASFLSQAPTNPDSLNALRQQVNQLTHIWTQEIRGNSSVYGERPGGFLGLATGADSLYSLEPLQNLMARFLDLKKIQASGRDFAVGTVSLVSGLYREWNTSQPNFLDLIRASSSIPVIFPFVKTLSSQGERDILVDGGVRNITPLSSAFDARPDEIYVLLTSRLIPTDAGGLPPNGATTTTYQDWDDNWLGTKVSGLTVLKRAVELLTDEVYLEDLRGALDWNRVLLHVERLAAALDSLPVPDAVGDAVRDLKLVAGKKHVPIHILAPRVWYGSDNSSTDFSPKFIDEAIEHGRAIASNEALWVHG